jgi:hypothetical protein
MIDLRKPIIKRYHQYLLAKSRRIQGSMSLSQRLIQDCVFGTNEVFTSYITYNYKPILMEMWEYELRQRMTTIKMRNGTSISILPNPLFDE